jgi:hypothetical protein
LKKFIVSLSQQLGCARARRGEHEQATGAGCVRREARDLRERVAATEELVCRDATEDAPMR